MTTVTNKSARIMTRHPEGKSGMNIERHKYDPMKKAILKVVPARGDGVRFKDLPELVQPHLSKTAFPPKASIMWYCVTVKLDLEARGLIERVPGRGPQRLRKSGKSR